MLWLQTPWYGCFIRGLQIRRYGFGIANSEAQQCGVQNPNSGVLHKLGNSQTLARHDDNFVFSIDKL